MTINIPVNMPFEIKVGDEITLKTFPRVYIYKGDCKNMFALLVDKETNKPVGSTIYYQIQTINGKTLEQIIKEKIGVV